MLDLDAISQEVLLARGRYSTVRAEHEEAKKVMSRRCGNLMSIASQILKKLANEDDSCKSAADLLKEAHEELEAVELLAVEIESLAAQRKALKTEAWPK